MKNNNCRLLKSLFCVTMSLLLLLSNLMFYEKEAHAVLPLTQIKESEYYGRQQLAEMDNGDALVKAYDKLAAGVENAETTINVYDASYPITTDEIKLVFEVYINDYPQHFWRKNAYSYSYYSTGYVVSLTPKYSFTGTELETARAEYDAALNSILSKVNGDMSEFERELIIHDAIAEETEFISGATYAHEAYGALVDKKAVCEGYARAFQDVLYKAGILSTTVTGIGNGGGHAWNLVRIDGKYYYTDLSWDDQSPTIYHEYFNLPLENMSIDHTLDTTIDTPEANSLDGNYFNVMGGWLEELTLDGVVAEMKDDLKAELYMDLDIDISEISNWLGNNISSIAGECGVTGGFSYSCKRMNRQYIITITPSSGTRTIVAVAGVGLNVTSYKMTEVGESFKLQANVYPETATNTNVTYSSLDTNVAVVDKYTGVIKAIGEGTTDIVVTTEDGAKTTKCSVTVDLGKEELAGKLEINGSSEAQTVSEGDTICFDVSATGGEGDYTYQYKMYNFSTAKWSTLKKYSEDAQYEYADLQEGKYRFVVQVKDSAGTVVDTNKINITVESNELTGTLRIDDSSSNKNVKLNDTIKLNVSAAGGTGEYTYRYMMYDFSTGKWSTIKGFSTTQSVSYKITTEGNKRFVVQVKDSSGTIVDTNKITINVITEELSGTLKVNNSTAGATISSGSSIKLSVQGAGGTGGYTYQYKVYTYSNAKWSTLKSYTTDTTYVWTPSATGKYRLVVQVKDSSGTIVDSNKITVTIN